MSRARTMFCNVLWLVTCLPAHIRFCCAVSSVRRVQTAKLLRLLHLNRKTHYGREHRFDRIHDWPDSDALPTTDYENYRPAVERIINGQTQVLTRAPVEILQPTSGTSSASKLIPHTASSAREIQSALDPWIVDLFAQRPRLLLGSQYWSISPSTKLDLQQSSEVPVGFLEDTEYFGKWRRWIIDGIMAVPSEVGSIDDIEAHQYVTLLFLLRAKDMGLISVWHPSFLTLLLDALRAAWPRLLADLERGGIDADISIPANTRRVLERRLRPDRERARELKRFAPDDDQLCQNTWPHLQVISCWREGQVQSAIAEIRHAFPGVLIQGKGLLATEGVVSIPLGRSQQHVCAVTSHVLEFEDDAGAVLPIWEVRLGQEYRVIVTTGGGLYRYQLRDRVEVTGFHKQAPCIRFLGRAGVVSDCVGEKLHAEHVDAVIADVTRHYFHELRFAMLVPSADGTNRRYTFLVEEHHDSTVDWQAATTSLESGLCRNYHYAHARAIGQLQHVAITRVGPDAHSRYRTLMTERGAVAGTVKFPALCTVPGIERYLQ